MSLAGKRCRFGKVGFSRINVTLRGVSVRTVTVSLAGASCAVLNSGMGTRLVIGRGAIGATGMQAEPCRIMAYLPGRAVPLMAALGAGTSGRRPR